MDDDMEDEIICEIFKALIHLLWKTITIIPMNLASHVIQNVGEISKLYKPSSVIILTLIIISFTIFVQIRNNWFKEALQLCHKTFTFNVVTDQSLKSFVAASVGSDNSKHELTEGIVGVYALQGRRGTMEDKFSVMQEVDVGGTKKLSFFGVYDGHGGQFVAEYVKQNLFINTVQKIRQLRTFVKEKNFEPNKRGSVSHILNKKKASMCVTISEISSEFFSSENKYEEKQEDKNDANFNIDGPDNNAKSLELDIASKAQQSENNVSKGKDIEKKENPEKSEVGNEVSMKKEDPYSSLKLKKRFSESNISVTTSTKESEENGELSDNTSYIDINSNVNYTKLLNDQIMDIDQKVVQFCKTSTDFSGTTAVIAILDGEMLIIGNVGDSRAVMGDLKGSTIPLSFDHKPNQLKERRRIKEAGGFITFTGVWRVAGVLATSRALGDFPLKDPRKLITAEPDVLTFSLKDHKAHFVILATDGLWDVLSNEEAVAFVRNHIQEKDHGARSLVLHAYERGSQDNITVMILNLNKLSL